MINRREAADTGRAPTRAEPSRAWSGVVAAIALAGAGVALLGYKSTADLQVYDLDMRTQVRTMPPQIAVIVIPPEVHATLDSTLAFNALLKKVLHKLIPAGPKLLFIEDDFTVAGQDEPEVLELLHALATVANVGPGLVDGKPGMALPLPRVREVLSGVGHSLLLTDAADMGVRSFPWTLSEPQGATVEAVAAVVARASEGAPAFRPRHVELAGPTGSPPLLGGPIYWFPHFRFRTDSPPLDVRAFLADGASADSFHGKTVLLFMQQLGSQRVVYPPLPGGGGPVHLAALDAIAAVSEGVHFEWLPATWVAALCGLLAVGSGTLLGRLGARMAHAAMLGLVLLLPTAAIALLAGQRLWLPLAVPLAVLMSTWLARILYHGWMLRGQLTDQMTILTGMLRETPSGVSLVTARYAPFPATRNAARLIEATIEQLGAERRLMVELTSHLPVGVIGFDASDRVVMGNEAAARLLSAPTAGELVGKHATELSDRLVLSSGHGADLSLRDGLERMEVTTPEGRAVRILTRRFVRAAGVASVVVLDDVTAERSALQERDEALDFLSHDLRSPLSSLIAMIGMRALENESPHDRIFLGNAHRMAENSIALCNQFLELARSDTRDAPAFEPFDLAELAEDVCEEFESICAAARVTLQRRLEFADTEGDSTMLLRVLRNLLENAVRHAPLDSQVDVTVSAEEIGSVVRIRDRGAGFGGGAPPGADRPASAQRFSLGLAFVRKACTLHRATLLLEDAKPGACVTLVLRPCGRWLAAAPT